MSHVPDTRYARSGDAHIAYQVSGEGPFDLAYFGTFVSHLELDWEAPEPRRFFERLGAFSRVIRMDKRGVGLSDPVAGGRFPTLEQRMEDVRAVLDAAGSESAALFGNSEGGPLAILFAATYPERARALVLHSSYARVKHAEDYPHGATEDQFEFIVREVERTWGTDELVRWWVPSAAGDERLRRWLAEAARRSSSPGATVAQLRMNWETDIRDALPAVRVPTLVMYGRRERWVPPEHGRYLAAHIPGAREVELDGGDHYPYLGDTDRILAETQEFLTGARPAPRIDRVLATVLFTDIVGSTGVAAELGDERWNSLLSAHDATARSALDTWSGTLIKTTGDGILATFDGPGRAIRCAHELGASLKARHVEIRSGIHTGEVELRDDGDIGGIAVHIAARVMGEAGPNEIVCSRTVKDLSAGSGFSFDDRGTHALRGVPDEWQLFAVRVD